MILTKGLVKDCARRLLDKLDSLGVDSYTAMRRLGKRQESDGGDCNLEFESCGTFDIAHAAYTLSDRRVPVALALQGSEFSAGVQVRCIELLPGYSEIEDEDAVEGIITQARTCTGGFDTAKRMLEELAAC